MPSPGCPGVGIPAAGDLDLQYADYIRGARLLHDLLVRAGDAKLPPIKWTVHPSGNLSAAIFWNDDDQIVTWFCQWKEFLGAQRITDDVSPLGTLTLRARVSESGCTVTINAYLDVPARGDDQ